MAKFVEGAWITVLLIPALVIFMSSVKRTISIAWRKRFAIPGRSNFSDPRPPLVVLPVQNWSQVSQKALRVALTLSDEIHAVHVCVEGEKTDIHESGWSTWKIRQKAAGFRWRSW